jgi:Flp pilus assembly protein TadG
MNPHHPQTTRFSRRLNQRGSALVEFAFILPVFILLVFGGVSASVALHNKMVLTQATREGARVGITFVLNRTEASIQATAQQVAQAYCDGELITFGAASSCTVPTPSVSGDLLNVQAEYTYSGLIFFPSVTLASQTTMRLE